MGELSESDFARFREAIEARLDGTDAPLAVLEDGLLDREDVVTETDRLIGGFAALGLIAGDRIALFCRDDRMLILLVIAALRAGLAPVMGDANAKPSEAMELLGTCRPAAIFADGETLAVIRGQANIPSGQMVEVDNAVLFVDASPRKRLPEGTAPPEIALMIFTSGTTSAPKAVELTYANLTAQFEVFAEVYGFDTDTRLLNLLPLHHVDGLIRGPLTALWFGGTVYRRVEFSVQNVPMILDSVAIDGITHFITVPAMLRIIDRVGQDQRSAFNTPNFRFLLSSADHLNTPLWSRFEEAFGVPVANAYGLSEVVCDAVFAGPSDDTRRIGSIGRAVRVEARIVDKDGHRVPHGQVGELTLSGPTIMRGYFNAPKLTAEVLKGEVFHTGDLVREADDGLLEFAGRKKTAIVSAGVTIYPEGIAEVISSMVGISEAYVFGEPDDIRGERLVAAVSSDTVARDDIWTFCRENLSPERVPAEIRMVDKLPRGASGKVIVAELVHAGGGDTNSSEETVYSLASACFKVPVSALHPDSTPFNTEGWDSLAHMALIEELEEAFDVVFSASEIAEITSLGQVEALIKAGGSG
ncbi:AMP-binding protein [Aliiroseovarius sp. YM-037]|uniref:AMP-binding protein n=1 Tax=Aliiroseovarius sp. YM-037 TaxID=3341728 RepID=UPI003A80A07C